jgi:hypothetical protein
MRRGVLFRPIAFASCAVSLLACGADLFHDTSWPNACDLDPSTSGCPGISGGADAAVDAPAESATSDAVEASESPIDAETGTQDVLDGAEAHAPGDGGGGEAAAALDAQASG